MKRFGRWFAVWLLCSLLTLALSACEGDDDDAGGDADDDDDDDDDDNDDDDNDDNNDDDNDNDDNDDNNDDNDNDDDNDTTPQIPDFVTITHGAFTMGSPGGEVGRRDDETQHDVTLTRDFEMQTREATQEQFIDLLGFNPSRFPVLGTDFQRPVETVSWFDVLAFSNRLSERAGYAACFTLTDIVCDDGEPGDTTDYCNEHGGILDADVSLNGAATVYDCEGYRPPTEAEWEYAARAGTTTSTYNGNVTVAGCSPLDSVAGEIAWYCANSNNTTHLGGEKLPNAWGLYDMAGNVTEWTWDWYSHTYPGAVTDPDGPDAGFFRAVRGGECRYSGAIRLRSAQRGGQTPGWRHFYIGFRVVRTLPAAASAAVDFRVTPAAAEAKVVRDYPDELPFEFTRPDVGDPLTPEEIDAFTTKITTFFKNTNYFHWLIWMTHGMVEGNPEGMPDFKLWFGDVSTSKTAGVVDMTQTGFDDNMTIPSSKLFNNIMAFYLMTGDEDIGRLVEQFAKGYVALFLGMQWAEEESEPEHRLLARAIFTQNHDYEEEGRPAHVNYDPVKHYSYDWNAHTIPNPNNPYWGDIWVRNMRSKDDVPHIYRVVPMLMRVIEDGVDEEVRDACAEALDFLQGFAKDVVDSGYYTRTKEDGNQWVPVDENGFVVDLASYVLYTPLVPNAECSGRLSSALIGYGSPLDVDCGDGIGWIYEIIATYGHYYNAAIVRYFHVATVTNALMVEANDTAFANLEGLATRTDYMLYEDPMRETRTDWYPDAAAFILAEATAGMPLTSAEARLVMDEYTEAVDHYSTWAYWDPWDASVPDGAFPQSPSRDSANGPVIAWDEILYLFEYCYAPFRNPATAPLIDCDIVSDPTQW
jgi:formylglycine-generating enzyme required for sulfatase activity